MPGEVQLSEASKAFGQPTKGKIFACTIGYIPAGARIDASFISVGSGPIITSLPVPIVTNSFDTISYEAAKTKLFPDPNSIEVYPHNHASMGPAMTLTDGNESVRNSTILAKMSHGCNVPASGQFNTTKTAIPIKLS